MSKLIKVTLIGLILVSTSIFANSTTTRLLLREVQYSADTPVRVSAVETLKDFLSDSEVERTLLNVLQNVGEDRNVRIATVKALSTQADEKKIYDVIVRAHDQSNDTVFRATCLQALYKAAPRSNQIERGLISNLLNAPAVEIRRASAFGLMAATNDRTVSDALTNVAMNPRNDVRQRIEAIKSLYAKSTDSRLRTNIQAIAENGGDNLDVRVAAVRFMTTFPQGTRARNVLERIIELGGNSSVRSMAAQAIRFNLRENDVRWFHLPVDPRGNINRDPFDGAESFSFNKVDTSLDNGGGINFLK
ncbi:MAG: hypothetical protein ACJAT2_003034 [Bacteriovoracaceae bacterium]|jgi:hypothetical protein